VSLQLLSEKFLQIAYAAAHAFYVITDIQHNAGKEVKYQRETYGKEGGIDKKQPDFIDGDVKAFAQVGTNPERIAFKKSEDALQHNLSGEF